MLQNRQRLNLTGQFQVYCHTKYSLCLPSISLLIINEILKKYVAERSGRKKTHPIEKAGHKGTNF